MDFAGLLGDAASGGLLGLGGSLATGVLGYFREKEAAKAALEAKKADNSHEVEMARINGAAAEAQRVGEFAIEQMKQQYAAFMASIADQTAATARVSPWAADVLALFRPGLTTMLVGGTICAIGFKWNGAEITGDLVQLTAVAVAWWFGDRAKDKSGK